MLAMNKGRLMERKPSGSAAAPAQPGLLWQRSLYLSLTLLFALLMPESGAAQEQRQAYMKIKIEIGQSSMDGVLFDNPTARDFAARLPLQLQLEDYAGKEKISMLTGRLSIENAPSGSNAKAGDITYYAPWGNLAIFYKDHGLAAGLVSVGRLESVSLLVQQCEQSCLIRIVAVLD